MSCLLIKGIKGSNYREFLKDKNVLLCTRLYKYAPTLESLLTQQYVCVMCTFWFDNTCVFTRFHCVKNANTQLIWSSAMLNILIPILLFYFYCITIIKVLLQWIRNCNFFYRTFGLVNQDDSPDRINFYQTERKS